MIVNNSVMWEDSTVEMTAGKFFREQFENENKNNKKTRARDEAQEFIKDILKDGPVLSTIVEDSAKKAGINHNTLQAAKTDLKIISKKKGPLVNCKWYWVTPEQMLDFICEDSKIPNE
jgi:hypothetical protein